MDEFDDLLAGVEARVRAERGVVGSLRALPRHVRGVVASGSSAAAVGVSMLCSPAGALLDGYALRLTVALAIAIVALRATLPRIDTTGSVRPKDTWCLVTIVACALAPFALHAASRDQVPTSATIVGIGCFFRGLVVAIPMMLVTWALARRGEGVRTRGAFIGLFSGAIGLVSVELACRHHDELHGLALHAPLVALLCAACALASSERVTAWWRGR